jgi:hypothetical protein
VQRAKGDDPVPQEVQTLFGDAAAVQDLSKGSAEINTWFEKNAEHLDALDPKQAKALAQLEKKYPEALQNRLVTQLVAEYPPKETQEADMEVNVLRQHLSPQLMAAVDKSVIEKLEAAGKQEVAKAYQENQLAMQPISYNDVLKLDQLAKDLQAGRTLTREEQEKLLAEAKQTLETVSTKPLTGEQLQVMQAAKERLDNLERALPLVDKSKVTKTDILKTIAGSAGLAASLTAIGALISLLVKLSHSESSDEIDSDQNKDIEAKKDEISAKEKNLQELIEAKKDEISAKEKNLQELKDAEKELLNKGAGLSDDEIKRKAEQDGLEEVIKANKLDYSNTNSGVKDPKPSQLGKEMIKKFVDDALTEHHEDQIALSNLQEKLNTANDQLNSLYKELGELEQLNSLYKEPGDLKNQPVPNHTKAETGILASIGIGGFSLLGGAAGLWAVNSSKVVPKVKLRRANTQAVQSLNKVVKTNQQPVSEINHSDTIKPEPIGVRRNSI